LKINGRYSKILKSEKWINATPVALPKDIFGPLDSHCMKLASTVKVSFVANQMQVTHMEKALRDSDFIGVNSQCRPAITKRDILRPALFQIANRKEAFLIDLIALANNDVLDKVLISLFSNKRTIFIGFNFDSVLSIFKRSFKEMKFY